MHAWLRSQIDRVVAVSFRSHQQHRRDHTCIATATNLSATVEGFGAVLELRWVQLIIYLLSQLRLNAGDSSACTAVQYRR